MKKILIIDDDIQIGNLEQEVLERLVLHNSNTELSEVEVGKLFDRFYTVENAKGSTGLGLSIARLLTEKMGGRIQAEYDKGRLILSITF